MVSEIFQKIEAASAGNQVTHDEFVQAIAYKLKKDIALINRACYLTSVSLGSRPCDVILHVNEFLASLYEEEFIKPDEPSSAGEFIS
jgi:hypothetical protein